MASARSSPLFPYALPEPAALAPLDVAVQACEFLPSGPFVGVGALSNGLNVRAAGTGCP